MAIAKQKKLKVVERCVPGAMGLCGIKPWPEPSATPDVSVFYPTKNLGGLGMAVWSRHPEKTHETRHAIPQSWQGDPGPAGP